MDYLNELSGSELVTLATVISIWISQNLTSDEINTLGNFFTALGSNLTLISGQLSNE